MKNKYKLFLISVCVCFYFKIVITLKIYSFKWQYLKCAVVCHKFHSKILHLKNYLKYFIYFEKKNFSFNELNWIINGSFEFIHILNVYRKYWCVFINENFKIPNQIYLKISTNWISNLYIYIGHWNEII